MKFEKGHTHNQTNFKRNDWINYFAGVLKK